MAFKLRSGNLTTFKTMGSSPNKDMKTGSYKQSFESPAKQRLKKEGEAQDEDKIFDDKGNHIGNWVNDKKVMFNDKPAVDPKVAPKQHPKRVNPFDKKKSLTKQDNEIDVPRWITDDAKELKEIKKKSPAKQKMLKGTTIFGKTISETKKDPMWSQEAFKKKIAKKFRKGVDAVTKHVKKYPKKLEVKKSPAKQTDTTWADGSKKSKREQEFSKRHTAEEQKYPHPRKFTNKRTKTISGEKSSGLGPRAKNSGMTRKQTAINKAEMSGSKTKSTYRSSAEDMAKEDPYWYKVNNKKVPKHIYLKYQNKPGGDEPGKQTNNPDAYGYKAKREADRAKLKKK